MRYRLIISGSIAITCIGALVYLRYKRRKEGWTVFEKVLLIVGGIAVVATVIIATQDYKIAKSALEATGDVISDQNIVDKIDLQSMPTLGDIAKEFNLSPQKAKHLIEKLNFEHTGEVIRTGLDYGWYYCKVYGPEVADQIRGVLSKYGPL